MQVNDDMVRAAADKIAEMLRSSRTEKLAIEDIARESLNAALAHMWRPIDAEVKDGRPGILFSPSGEDLNCKGGLIWISGGFGKGAIHPGWRGETNKEQPTRFMPLPTPPRGE